MSFRDICYADVLLTPNDEAALSLLIRNELEKMAQRPENMVLRSTVHDQIRAAMKAPVDKMIESAQNRLEQIKKAIADDIRTGLPKLEAQLEQAVADVRAGQPMQSVPVCRQWCHPRFAETTPQLNELLRKLAKREGVNMLLVAAPGSSINALDGSCTAAEVSTVVRVSAISKLDLAKAH